MNVPSGNVGQAKQTDFREFKWPLASVAEGAKDNNHNCQRRSYTGIQKAAGQARGSYACVPLAGPSITGEGRG